MPKRSRAAGYVAVIAALVAAPLLGGTAHASSYGTPTITLADNYLSGAVGSTGDPVATVTVAQSGATASQLTVTATHTTGTTVAQPHDVTITGTGATRTIAVAAEGEGETDITLKVTGGGSKTASTTLHYAASQSVQDSAETRYWTGASDASAAVDLGGGYTVVGDDETNQLRVYQDQTSGAPVKSWDFSTQLGISDSDELDLEAAARVGNTIYWTGSMGNNKDGDLEPDRAILFTTNVTGSGATANLTFGGYYTGLRDDLISWDEANGNRFGFAAGAAEGQIPKEADGFNVEGLEFAPNSTSTAYIAFRAPLVPPVNGGKALLVPVTNIDQLVAGTPQTATHATFGAPVQMDLGGLSFRDIRKNAQNQYLIIAGSFAADDPSEPYVLYSWDGVPADAPTQLMTVPTEYGGWEDIVSVPDLTQSAPVVQLVQDDGSADLYGDGTEAKDLDQPEWQKSRTTWFTL